MYCVSADRQPAVVKQIIIGGRSPAWPGPRALVQTPNSENDYSIEEGGKVLRIGKYHVSRK